MERKAIKGKSLKRMADNEQGLAMWWHLKLVKPEPKLMIAILLMFYSKGKFITSSWN